MPLAEHGPILSPKPLPSGPKSSEICASSRVMRTGQQQMPSFLLKSKFTPNQISSSQQRSPTTRNGTLKASRTDRKTSQKWPSRLGRSDIMRTRKPQNRKLRIASANGDSLTTAEAAALAGYARDHIGLMIRKGVITR